MADLQQLQRLCDELGKRLIVTRPRPGVNMMAYAKYCTELSNIGDNVVYVDSPAFYAASIPLGTNNISEHFRLLAGFHTPSVQRELADIMSQMAYSDVNMLYHKSVGGVSIADEANMRRLLRDPGLISRQTECIVCYNAKQLGAAMCAVCFKHVCRACRCELRARGIMKCPGCRSDGTRPFN